jgi:hypothetical protein
MHEEVNQVLHNITMKIAESEHVMDVNVENVLELLHVQM